MIAPGLVKITISRPGYARRITNQVFLSYAHDDLEMVKKVYDELVKRKVDVWFDKVDLSPEKWLAKIKKTIPRSRYFLICLSEAYLRKTGDNKPGFIGDELNFAYQIAMDQPESTFTIVPVRLEDCGRGDLRTTTFQQYDLFEDFESVLDHLAIHLGGISLAGKLEEDTRTEDEKTVERLVGRAEILFYAAEYIRAINYWASALDLSREIGDRQGEGTHLGNMGLAYSSLGQNEKAIECHIQALTIFEEIKSPFANRARELIAELEDQKTP